MSDVSAIRYSWPRPALQDVRAYARPTLTTILCATDCLYIYIRPMEMLPISSLRKKFLRKTFIHVEAIVVHSTNGHTSPCSKKIFLNAMHARRKISTSFRQYFIISCLKSKTKFDRDISSCRTIKCFSGLCSSGSCFSGFICSGE